MMTSSDTQQKLRARHQGTVKWFSASKGYGFILPNDPSINNGAELFVHFYNLVMKGFKYLREGDVVEFSLGSNSKGLCAKEVKIIKIAEETHG
ncbi:MAG: cold-shock protein [Pseudobdellovibrionaceae bacterium]